MSAALPFPPQIQAREERPRRFECPPCNLWHLWTSDNADHCGGDLEPHFVSRFLDGIHATAGLAWVESWPLRFCRHHSVLLALGLGTDCSTAIILVEPSVLPFCTHHLGRTDRSTATILVEPSVLPFCTHHSGRTDRSTATILVEPSVLPFRNRPFW